MSKFLILGSVNYANRRLLHEFKALGKEASILNPNRLLPCVNDKENDLMYVTSVKSDEPKRLYKKSVAGIVPRIGSGLKFHAKSVEHLHKNMGIPTTAKADALLNAQDKVKTIQLLSQRIIKTPRTFAIKGMVNTKWIVEKLGGFPVVGKLLFGSQGKGVFILTEALSAKTTVDTFLIQGNELLLQQYIETAEKNHAKKDFRAVVVDGKVVAAIQRNSVGDDFRTNSSLKEDCEGVELDEEMTAIALKCADAVGLAVAGVDLAKDVKTGAIYCYEVNGNMNYKSTEKFSKKNVAKAIAEYAIRLADAGDKDDKIQAQQYAKELQTSRLAPIYYPRFSGTNHTNDPNRFESSEFSGGVKGIPFGDFPDDENDEKDDDIEFENKSIHFHQSNTIQPKVEQYVPVWANTCKFNQDLFEKLKVKGLRTEEDFRNYTISTMQQNRNY